LNKFLPFYVLGLSQSAVKLTDLQSSMSAIWCLLRESMHPGQPMETQN